MYIHTSNDLAKCFNDLPIVLLWIWFFAEQNPIDLNQSTLNPDKSSKSWTCLVQRFGWGLSLTEQPEGPPAPNLSAPSQGELCVLDFGMMSEMPKEARLAAAGLHIFLKTRF